MTYLQIICLILLSFSLAASFIFFLVGLEAKLEKSFFAFGTTNLLLVAFVAIDVYYQPYGSTFLEATKYQHIIASFFPPFIFWYLSLLIKDKKEKTIKILLFIGFIFTLLFSSNVMFKKTDIFIHGTWVYNFLFTPYIFFSIAKIKWYLYRNYLKSQGFVRKVLLGNVVGAGTLGLCGLIDLLNMGLLNNNPLKIGLPNYTLIGVIFFSSYVSYTFIRHLNHIILDRGNAYLMLRKAYKELEAVQVLKDLGQSSRIINHQIKKYSEIIHAQINQLNLNDSIDKKGKMLIRSILRKLEKINKISGDINDYTEATKKKDTFAIDLNLVLVGTIDNYFIVNSDVFKFRDDISDSCFVKGDWDKLENAFYNIFKNSLEAKAKKVKISLEKSDQLAIITIEDDGEGCKEDDLDRMFEAFYTTKEHLGCNGLGLPIARSIIKSHNGKITAYSNNSSSNDSHGLSVYILLPLARQKDNISKNSLNSIIFVKEEIRQYEEILRILNNAGANPIVVEKASDLVLTETLDHPAIIANSKAMVYLKKIVNFKFDQHVIVSDKSEKILIVNPKNTHELFVFSEHYVISQIFAQLENKTKFTEK